MIKEETINRIRKFTKDRNFEQFHSGANLAKALSCEAAEVLELFLWQDEPTSIENLKDELADVLVYTIDLIDKYGFDVDKIINDKMEKNEKKYPVEKSFGKSTKYNNL